MAGIDLAAKRCPRTALERPGAWQIEWRFDVQPDRSTSTAEREATLDQLEAVIDSGRIVIESTFREIGGALRSIRDNQLYRERGHTTLATYVDARFGMSSRYAYLLMDASETVSIIEQFVIQDHKILNAPVLPTTERQVRPLRQLAREDPQLAAEAWQETVAEHGPDPTAAQVTEKVVKVYGSLQKSSEPKPRRSLQGALDRGTAQAGRLRSRVTERVAREAPTSVLDSYAPPSQVASVVMEPIEPTLRTFRQMLDLMQAWLTPSEQAGIAALVEDEGALQAYIRRLDGLLGAAHQVRDALESGQF